MLSRVYYDFVCVLHIKYEPLKYFNSKGPDLKITYLVTRNFLLSFSIYKFHHIHLLHLCL